MQKLYLFIVFQAKYILWFYLVRKMAEMTLLNLKVTNSYPTQMMKLCFFFWSCFHEIVMVVA